ncbi:MAG: hypothetical protein HYU78_02250 [Rhodocyclales bacterium]|nr:hypothetical protein [Rhodocyclales bacterium]
MQLALYKGTRPGLAGIFNRAVRWWTRGPYSHCELVLWRLPDGTAMCGSASNTDGGVRIKAIDLDPARWDLVELPRVDPFAAFDWFEAHAGDGYDLRGLFGFVWRRGDGDRDKYYCSEACAAAIGIDEPWRFDPNTLAAVARFANRL